jgi:hypothetical protein
MESMSRLNLWLRGRARFNNDDCEISGGGEDETDLRDFASGKRLGSSSGTH